GRRGGDAATAGDAGHAMAFANVSQPLRLGVAVLVDLGITRRNPVPQRQRLENGRRHDEAAPARELQLGACGHVASRDWAMIFFQRGVPVRCTACGASGGSFASLPMAGCDPTHTNGAIYAVRSAATAAGSAASRASSARRSVSAFARLASFTGPKPRIMSG